MPEPPAKVWAGRLGARTAPLVERYTSSVGIDQALWADDIAASLAHARMLRAIGLLSAAEHRELVAGLRAVRDEFRSTTFRFDEADEDVHTAVERRLHELIGATAGKLHTGRSRNDQVATDLRLWAMRAAAELVSAVTDLQDTLIDRAAEHRATVMPGYTHLQRAQPVTLGHHLLAYVEMLQRDVERLIAARTRTCVLPLGAGALAASTLPLDRDLVRESLRFAAVSANSLDAVSDRDFAIELAACCALLLVHLSRLGEELVLWSSSEFGFVELPDTHATGSSLMPQKKNPDVAELIRGRSARAVGDLVTLLTLVKGLPLSYNRDLQEDKHALFDVMDTATASVGACGELLRVAVFNTNAMRAAADDAALLATDVAEYLVQRGVPFRAAHTLVGRAVADTQRQQRSLRDLSVREWRAYSKRFDNEVTALFDLRGALARRDMSGGPGPRSVARQLRRARSLTQRNRRQT